MKGNPAPLTVVFGCFGERLGTTECALCGVDHEMDGFAAVEDEDTANSADPDGPINPNVLSLCPACHKEANARAVLRKLEILAQYGDRIDDDTTAH